MAKFYETNFYSSRQPDLCAFLDEFKRAHKGDKHDWYLIRANDSINPVQFAIPEHVQLDAIGVPKSGTIAIVVGPLRVGSATFYAMSPYDEEIFFDGIFIFHDGLFFSEYDTKAQRLLTSQSIPNAEHVSKTPHGIREKIQRWIPWSYLAPSFVGMVD